MHTFHVWAPLPEKVGVQVGDNIFPMTASVNGWRMVTVPTAVPGDDYGFILDGEGPFPDPRSPWQPAGIHGLSRLLDSGSFRWTDDQWQAPPLSAAIIYELHIGTFTPQGTFAAAIEKLDHLVYLGITHVELMPVNEFPGDHGWGYDGVDLYAPHHRYGGPAGLKHLVDACHARRLAVILDVVYNHLGPLGNYLARFGPYFTSAHSSPWGPGINYDGADSDEVRRFFCDNALMWLHDYHFDGLRLDAVHGIFDASAEPFLEQLGSEVRRLGAQLGRHLVLIPESDLNDPRLLWPRERGGFGLDAQWSDDFHHALHVVLTGERNGYYRDFGSLEKLCKAFQNAYVYDGCYSICRRRRHGRPPEGLSGHRFLGYLQNHDQVGNRAQGERSARLMSQGRLKMGAAAVLASPFLPMLFQGEEWGASTPFLYFTDYQEPALANSVSEGRCREFAAFGWQPEATADPQAVETFERSKLNWPELERQPHADLLEWHRQLIRLRRNEPALNDGRMKSVGAWCDEPNKWFVINRGPVSLAFNLGDRLQCLPLQLGNLRLLIASHPDAKVIAGHVSLPPDSMAILKQDDSSMLFENKS